MRGGICDGRGETVGERLFAAFESKDGGLARRSPVVLLDLQEGQDGEIVSWRHRVSEGTEAVVDWSLDHVLDPYLAELRQRRLRELQVKERYLKHSLNMLISQSNRKLGEYHQRQAGGGIWPGPSPRRRNARKR